MDKSIKDLPLPKRNTDNTFRPSVLAVHRSAGVQKKSKPVRKARMTSKMRRRHEKGLEMAEAVTEKTGKKIERSIGRYKNVQSRSRDWKDINKEAVEEEEEGVKGSRFGALMEDEWVDEDDDDDVEDGDGFDPANPAASKVADGGDEEDDEIL